MKSIILKVTAALTLVGAPALGVAENTAWFSIDRLSASTSSSNGYRIYAADYSLPDQGCSKHDFAEVQESLSIGDVTMMNRTLLAAFMSGRKVQLRLDGCGVQGRPAYRIVRVDATQ